MGNDDEPGIIPLAIEELFSFISEQQDSRTFTLRVSFLEIYNEHLRDLLTDTPPRGAATKPLDVTGDDGRVFGLAAKSVATAQAVLDYLNEGERRRRVGATDWNERSSRSHCIFTVVRAALWSGRADEYRRSRARGPMDTGARSTGAPSST